MVLPDSVRHLLKAAPFLGLFFADAECIDGRARLIMNDGFRKMFPQDAELGAMWVRQAEAGDSDDPFF